MKSRHIIQRLTAQSDPAFSPDIHNYFANIDPIFGGGIVQGFNFSGAIAVRPSDPNASHNVSIHYTYDGSTWADLDATYVATEPDGYRSYTFRDRVTDEVFRYFNYSATYAIRYTEGQASYWNNNHGANFLVRTTNMGDENRPSLLDKSALFLDYALPCRTDGSAGGSIILKNLAYDKLVRVRYTTDCWNSYDEVLATYGGSYGYRNIDGTNLEYWNFAFEDVPCVSPVSIGFAISYTVHGVTYWDNNFTRNYGLSW